ncbi:major allergen I polypeptide chain 2-like [Moschus berezovskii]|uniref:major allergen I polypeptide chain 2-like n=1 Tax=Moschus berezovskii TaxID=68408 RepID=UPI002444B36F|nr:major allergen I polypeptide chain 2-like [Moschus berezovskii]
MNGPLLVLALLVTRELTFETRQAEACPAFYGVLTTVTLALPPPMLNETLDLVEATNAEKVALEKIQDCFAEKGLVNRLNHLKITLSIIFSKDCNGYKLSSVVNTGLGLGLSVTSLVI